MSDAHAGLKYVDESSLCWMRKRHGKGFSFYDQDHQLLTEPSNLQRVKHLAIPPNWEKVNVCTDEWGHIQAVGYDAKGRKQYLYHSEWQLQQQQHKFNKMVKFGEVLPTIREAVAADMRRHNVSRERVISTVVWLLENTFIRVGNTEYARDNQSYGLTTLREKHVEVHTQSVEFQFKGKSGVSHTVDIKNPQVARTIKRCLELPGYELFQYLDENGERQTVDSSDVNNYLRGLTGEEFSAKDFRTWGGTVLAATHLHQVGDFKNETQAKKNIVSAVKEVASHLRNLPATCRKYYIHPSVIQTYSDKLLLTHFRNFLKTHPESKNTNLQLHLDEQATWTLIKNHPVEFG